MFFSAIYSKRKGCKIEYCLSLGNNNLTLYAYFEFIKEILNYIYLSQEISNQAEIIPLIVGDIVPIIQSTLFIDYNNKEDSRIVTINLPMGALYNPVFYFPYLYHEIFHYVVPRDRYVRNEITGMMISIEILNSIIKYIIIQELHLDEDAIKLLDLFINKYIFRYTYSFVIRKFESDIDPSFRELRKRKLTNAQMNEEVKDAEQYEKSLFYRWINWCNEKKNIQLVNNPIQLYLIDLYSHKGNIEQELNMWLKDDLIEQDKKRGDRLKKISAVIGGFRKFTDNTDADLIDQAFEEAMNALNDNVVNDARLLVKAIKEAMADLAMVQLNAMEFVEYLLIFTKTDKDLTIDDKSKPEKEVQDVVRIGMILEYFCRRREDSGNYIGCIEAGKEDFINMYCGLYYSSHADNTKDTVNKLVKEAEEWFAHWVNCYKVYCCRYCSYKELVKKMWQQSLAGDSKMSPVSEYWKEFIHSLKEYGYFIRTADDKTPKSDWKERRQELDRRVFDVNLEVVYKYQAQRNFSDLNRNRKNVIERCNEESYIFDGKINDELNMSQIKLSWKRMINRKYIYEYKIDSIGSLGTVILEIVEQLKEANRRLLGKREYPIWYRGHQSKDYKLLPSIMRKFKEYEEKVRDPKDATLLKMFRREYEEFKFRADGAYEMIDRTGYTDSDYIALMQHYSVASNYLDWTEDALSSLYFAVEEFMDDKADSVDSDAALYIFSPALYNYDRVKLMREAKRDDTGLLEIEKRIIREVSKDIPNLTAPFNKGRYDVYMLGNDEYTDENDKLFSAESIGNKAAYYTPLAIYTSRINKRIQAQNGMFLAYNIYTPRSQEDEFDYIALEKIQDRYLNVFSSDEETYPFLYKIIIQKETKEDVAKWIKAFGMSKERCYPELSNIGERIMR